MTDTPSDSLRRTAAALADGRSIDWQVLAREGGLTSDELQALRTVAELARAAEPEVEGGRATGFEQGFEVRGVLGTGTSSRVLRAFDRALQREVALKIVHPERAGSPTVRERFLREARLLASLRHPGVVQVYAIDEAEGSIRIVLELVEGRTLDQVVSEDGRLSADEAARVGADVAQALAALHERGLVHRDVKPANVMREREGRIVLLDFGIAEAAADRAHSLLGSAGTPRFMAPEQFTPGAAVDARADLWALAALLYWLVSGRSPYDAESFAELEAAVHAGRRVPLRDRRADLPAGFVQLVERALATDPAARPASAGEFEGELRAWLTRRTSGGSARPTWRLVAGLSVLVLVVAGTGVLLGRSGRPARRAAPEVRLFAARDGSTLELTTGGTVHLGDALHMVVRSPERCWLYVIDEDAAGAVFVLFPLPGFELQNPLPSGDAQRIPGALHGAPQDWVVTSEGGGRESLLVVASPEPLEDIEALLRGLPAAGPGVVAASVPRGTRTALFRGIAGTQAARIEDPPPGQLRPGTLAHLVEVLGEPVGDAPSLQLFALRSGP